MSTVDEPVSFERDIKPLFRDRDRGAMKFFIDLWSYDDVARESDEILERAPRRLDAVRRRVGRRSASPCSSSGSTEGKPPENGRSSPRQGDLVAIG